MSLPGLKKDDRFSRGLVFLKEGGRHASSDKKSSDMEMN